MKFLFWNVQRLGSATPEKRGEIMQGVVAEAFRVHNVDYALLCEVSGSTNLDGVSFRKQVSVVKRGTHARAAQLGYASIDSDLNEVTLEKYPLPKFTKVFDQPSPRKGGNEFTKHSKRCVAYVLNVHGVNVYVYHANASSKAPFLVAWVAEALRLEDDEDFLLIGDFNCEPPEVRTQLELLKRDPDAFEFGEDGPTHNAKTGLTKTYDYAIGGRRVPSAVTKLDISKTIAQFTNTPAKDMSDHLPIIVEI